MSEKGTGSDVPDPQEGTLDGSSLKEKRRQEADTKEKE